MIAHDVLTYLCAKSVGFSSRSVQITSYSYEDIDRDVYNRDFPFEMREGGRPTVTVDEPEFDENEYYSEFVHYDVPVNDTVPAIQVLSLYSAEPDWGMDFGLKLSPIQRFMAGSQGYRHLRFSLFRLRAGIVHERAVYFDRLSKEAFKRNDPYWGVRFAARALHYIEDLLTPVHTKPFPEGFLLERLFRLKSLYFTIYNYHMNFERFVGYHLWNGHERLIQTIQDAPVARLSSLKSDILKGWDRIRRLFYSVFKECRKLWGDSMGSSCVRLQKRDIEAINPPGDLLVLIEEWLHLAASIVKGYIEGYVLPSMKGV